ncbi:ferrous iron transport protein A [bacterium]|nr:ferrous iron transport protein A [bacterium]
MVPLFDLEEGEAGEIIEISKSPSCGCGGGHKHRNHCGEHGRFSDLGIRVGTTIKLLHKQHKGPLMVKVGDARFAIGRGMAEKIKIRNPHHQE